jgi:hypothetical protein
MSEHATETLFVVLHPDGWSIQTKQEGCGLAVARQYGNSDVSNARRLVACWNKFDGMTTDQIERMPGTVQLLGETFMAADAEQRGLLERLRRAENELVSLRNEALEVLELALPSVEDDAFQYGGSPDVETDEAVLSVRALIAKLKGGAA